VKIQKPTTQERQALERIEAANGLSVIAVVALAGLLPATKLLPERLSSVSAALSVILVLAAIGVLVYRACFLRCRVLPRFHGQLS
jgi:hypothetical protein